MKSLVYRVIFRLFSLIPGYARLKIIRGIMDVEAHAIDKSSISRLIAIHDGSRHYIDKVAIAMNSGVHPKHRIMNYHRYFTDRLGHGESVVDIGCGIGAVAYSMAKAGAIVVGIDFEKESIDFAKDRYQHPSLTFLVGTAPDDLPSGRYSTVVMSNVLEHIEKRVEFIRLVNAALSPSRWLIRVPMFNRDWLPSLKQELGLFPYSDPTHYIEYTEDVFRKEMCSAGMSIHHLQVIWGEIWAEVQPDSK